MAASSMEIERTVGEGCVALVTIGWSLSIGCDGMLCGIFYGIFYGILCGILHAIAFNALMAGRCDFGDANGLGLGISYAYGSAVEGAWG